MYMFCGRGLHAGRALPACKPWASGRLLGTSSGAPGYTGRLHPPVTPAGYTHTRVTPHSPRHQANNVYVFPALALGVILSRARRVDDGALLAAAEAVAGLVDDDAARRGAWVPGFG